jgi:hypothetical protein
MIECLLVPECFLWLIGVDYSSLIPVGCLGLLDYATTYHYERQEVAVVTPVQFYCWVIEKLWWLGVDYNPTINCLAERS